MHMRVGYVSFVFKRLYEASNGKKVRIRILQATAIFHCMELGQALNVVAREGGEDIVRLVVIRNGLGNFKK